MRGYWLTRLGEGFANFALLVGLASALFAPLQGAPAIRQLIVCADPNNLPFSNRDEQGFENKIVALLAHDMGARVSYVWWAQRRGYVRHTLSEAKCDIWPGVATGVDNIATTPAYYRSTYVFVTRADRALRGLTLDDDRLRSLSIGVQMIGDNAMNTPPAHALVRRGLIDNVHGYMLYGDYDRPNPAAAIVDAVTHGQIDVALVWGPLAGFFAHRSAVPLRLEPVTAQTESGEWPMVFDISMGMRPDTPGLRTQVESILAKEKPAIDAILRSYHVPQSSSPSFDSAHPTPSAM
jgi:mxaJ protein